MYLMGLKWTRGKTDIVLSMKMPSLGLLGSDIDFEHVPSEDGGVGRLWYSVASLLFE